MLKATIENFPILGSLAMLRRMESSALVSSGWSVVECEFCGAKFMMIFTFSGPSGCSRCTGGSSRNNSRSLGCIAPGAISRAICLSCSGRLTSTLQLLEQTRSERSRMSQSTEYLPSPNSKVPWRYASPLASSSMAGTETLWEKIHRLVRAVLRNHSKDHCEEVFGSCQLFKRNADFVTGTVLHVKP